MRNSDVLTVQSNPMPSDPLPQNYPQSGQATRTNTELRLTRAYHSAPSLVRSLPPWSLGKRRSLRNATWIAPHSTDKERRARGALPYEIERFPNARSEDHASRIVERTRNRPNGR